MHEQNEVIYVTIFGEMRPVSEYKISFIALLPFILSEDVTVQI